MLGNPLWVTNVADFTPTLEYHSGSNTVSVKQQQQTVIFEWDSDRNVSETEPGNGWSSPAITAIESGRLYGVGNKCLQGEKILYGACDKFQWEDHSDGTLKAKPLRLRLRNSINYNEYFITFNLYDS